MTQRADEFSLAAEFIGRTADAWRRRALAAEAALATLERDRSAAIARLAELTAVLRPDLEREEARHCDCCYRARQALIARPAEVIPFRAAGGTPAGAAAPRRAGRD